MQRCPEDSKQCSHSRCPNRVFKKTSSVKQWRFSLCRTHWTKRKKRNSAARRCKMKKMNKKRRVRASKSTLSAIDICTGTGSMRRAFTALKFSPVVSADISAKRRRSNRQNFMCGDVSDPQYAQKLIDREPDLGWSSVPCADFSHAKTTGETGPGKLILQNVLQIYHKMKTRKPGFLGLIENPLDDMRALQTTLLKDWRPIQASHCRLYALLRASCGVQWMSVEFCGVLWVSVG